MEHIKVFGSLLLLAVGAHAWGVGSNDQVDCSVSIWSKWSKPFVGGLQTRERSVLRHPAHGGKHCPDLLESHFLPRVKTNTTEEIMKISTKFIARRGSTLSGGQAKVRDLLVILDSSSSIGNTNFKLAVEQIAELLRYLCPEKYPFDRDMQKLAVLRYSSKVTEMFNFNAHKTTTSTIKAVKSITYTGGSTDTAQAFKKAVQMFKASKGARISSGHVEQEVLILTDGRSNNAKAAIAAAQSLKGKAKVFSLIIGDFTNAGKNEIVQYVSYPAQDHLFNLPKFDDLKKLVVHVRNSVPTQKCAPFDLG